MAHWPLSLLHPLGALLGWITFCASPTYRRRLVANAALAGYPFRRIAAAVAHAGRMVAETPRLWLGKTPPVLWGDTQVFETAYAARRGIVFFTPHMGCFEIAAQVVAERYRTRFGPLTVLYRPARQAWLSELMREARDRPGLVALPTTLASVRQMIRALRQGQAVGLLPDQVPPRGMGRWTPFFGRPAYTMTLGARLALQTGATVLLVWGERLGRGRGYRLHARPLAQPLAGDLDAALLQLNQEMEALIREAPSQYLWGYGRYKEPRAAPSS